MSTLPPLDPAFVRRRQAVWVPIGLAYASYYMCRYNWSVANKAIGDALHFTNAELGLIYTVTVWAYAVGQLVNGPIVDRVGGKRGMVWGASGSMLANLALAAGAWLADAPHALALGYFALTWGWNGYLQSFGAPSLVKVNANWLRRSERGTFTGVFGTMIQIGRWSTTALGGWLVVHRPWTWCFVVPPLVTLLITALTWLLVVDDPEDLGYAPVEPSAPRQEHPRFRDLVALLVGTPPLWFIAAAYFCTGVVRHGLDAWYAKYLQEVCHLRLDSWAFQAVALGIPVAAVLGSFAAGWLSDRVYHGRRPPAAGLMYLGQFVVLALFLGFPGPLASPALLALAQFFVNGPHALLGGAAAMDFGGRRAAGSAAGMIDFFQYLGAGLAGVALGGLIDERGWGVWIASLVLFPLLGAAAMAAIWRAVPRGLEAPRAS